ncbi:hypothetical protein DRJ54_07540 [Candidatus Acetothermia bacterium]|nr:MAG: hypothetical protein DRJ54_07540 [Candidatus Acetothermia bacterium]
MNEVYHVLNMALWRIKAAVDSSKEDRREALAYVCECIDAEFGEEALREMKEAIEQRLQAGSW